MKRSRMLAIGLTGAVAALLGWTCWGTPAGDAQDKAQPDKAAVERARDTAKLIDALYKNFVVQITETYAKDKKHIPAARVSKRVFKAMHEGGFHDARLIDATGDPINPDNAPKTDFEKRSVKLIKGGKGYVDEVDTVKGKPVLRVATVVPVVMKQCIMCHPGFKEGDVLGALVYEIPIK
jgi:hypothetical protein